MQGVRIHGLGLLDANNVVHDLESEHTQSDASLAGEIARAQAAEAAISSAAMPSVTPVTMNYTMLATDVILLCEGNITVNIIPTSQATNLTKIIKNKGTGTVVLTFAIGDTLENVSGNFTLFPGESISIIKQATNWNVL